MIPHRCRYKFMGRMGSVHPTYWWRCDSDDSGTYLMPSIAMLVRDYWRTNND